MDYCVVIGYLCCRAVVFTRVDGGQVEAVGGADVGGAGALGVTATAPTPSAKEGFPGEGDQRSPGNVVYYVI